MLSSAPQCEMRGAKGQEKEENRRIEALGAFGEGTRFRVSGSFDRGTMTRRSASLHYGSEFPERARTTAVSPLLTTPSAVTSERKVVASVT